MRVCNLFNNSRKTHIGTGGSAFEFYSCKNYPFRFATELKNIFAMKFTLFICTVSLKNTDTELW